MRVLTFLLPLLAVTPTLAADRALLFEAEQSYAQGRLEQARRQVDDYLATTPDDARANLLRAVIKEAADDRPGSLADYDRAVTLDPKFAPAYQRRGIAHFMLGHVKESVADFDKFLELRPDEKPQHWQRGIALYYAGRYEDGARQFELHKTVNPDDVENAAWHFLCVARWKGVDAARAQLIPVTGDARIPMAKVQELFAGKATPDDVLAAARANNPSPPQLNRQLFYAHLYSGLYEEALNHPDRAKEHLTLAADKYPVPDYMHGVAKVHVQRLNAPKTQRP
jgi:lipoprotein NlpI